MSSTASTDSFDEIAKRFLDLTVSALLIAILSPVLAVLAILVRLSSPGPILYRQLRIGRNGVPFHVLKFRSMRVAADGPSVTSGNDTRITPIGRRLRDWKLDELPQLFNVLAGQMSLVGPRPEVACYVAHYTDEQRRVLTARPGVTGACQLAFRDEEKILAGRADIETAYVTEILPAKLRIDLEYVRTRSLLGDLKILCLTVQAVLRIGRNHKAPSA